MYKIKDVNILKYKLENNFKWIMQIEDIKLKVMKKKRING